MCLCHSSSLGVLSVHPVDRGRSRKTEVPAEIYRVNSRVGLSSEELRAC